MNIDPRGELKAKLKKRYKKLVRMAAALQFKECVDPMPRLCSDPREAIVVKQPESNQKAEEEKKALLPESSKKIERGVEKEQNVTMMKPCTSRLISKADLSAYLREEQVAKSRVEGQDGA